MHPALTPARQAGTRFTYHRDQCANLYTTLPPMAMMLLLLLLLFQLTLVDEQFLLEDKSCVTSAAELCTESRTSAQHLLSHYVHMQGLVISQVSLSVCLCVS